ncbi:MAG: hypothetical protein ACI8VE_001353 [Natrialbaceae archaeon]|jgi:hypothetical protein
MVWLLQDVMVQKITLFEPHFDGATVGPSPTESTTEEAVLEEDITSDGGVPESGGSRGRKILALVVASITISVIVSVAARRFVGDEDEFEAVEFDTDEDAEPIEVEE